MPTYLYVCPICGHQEEHAVPLAVGNLCPDCEYADLRRDWKSEGANVNIANLKAAR